MWVTVILSARLSLVNGTLNISSFQFCQADFFSLFTLGSTSNKLSELPGSTDIDTTRLQ